MAKSNILITPPSTLVTDRAVVSSANAYAFAKVMTGTANVSNASVTVTGTGTNFTRLNVGDAIVARAANGVYQDVRIVTSIASATSMNVNAAFGAVATGQTLKRVKHLVVTSAYGWARAKALRGTVTTSGSSATVTGSGTVFAQDLKKGDRVIIMSNAVRATATVANVVSNTAITVTPNVNVAAAATILRFEEVLHSVKRLDARTDPTK